MPSLGMATHNSIVLTTARGCGGACYILHGGEALAQHMEAEVRTACP